MSSGEKRGGEKVNEKVQGCDSGWFERIYTRVCVREFVQRYVKFIVNE